MRKIALLTIPALLLASGCSSIINGKDEVVTIETSPAKPAHCLIDNGRGAWTSYTTPQRVIIDRSARMMTISCSTTDGWHGKVVVDPSLDPMAVATEVVAGVAGVAVGNVVAANAATIGSSAAHFAVEGTTGAANFAAAAGASVAGDVYTGTLFKYPHTIVVPLATDTVTPPDAQAGLWTAPKPKAPPPAPAKAPSLRLK